MQNWSNSPGAVRSAAREVEEEQREGEIQEGRIAREVSSAAQVLRMKTREYTGQYERV